MSSESTSYPAKFMDKTQRMKKNLVSSHQNIYFSIYDINDDATAILQQLYIHSTTPSSSHSLIGDDLLIIIRNALGHSAGCCVCFHVESHSRQS